jgi:hypothetical protein
MRLRNFVQMTRLLCISFKVKESDIETVLNYGKAMCVDDVSDLTNAGIGCRGCI